MPFRPSNAYLAIGKETIPGTAVAPTFAIPYAPSSLAGMEDIITELKDESIRGLDSTVKGVSQGKRMTSPAWNANAIAGSRSSSIARNGAWTRARLTASLRWSPLSARTIAAP